MNDKTCDICKLTNGQKNQYPSGTEFCVLIENEKVCENCKNSPFPYLKNVNGICGECKLRKCDRVDKIPSNNLDYKPACSNQI